MTAILLILIVCGTLCWAAVHVGKSEDIRRGYRDE